MGHCVCDEKEPNKEDKATRVTAGLLSSNGDNHKWIEMVRQCSKNGYDLRSQLFARLNASKM